MYTDHANICPGPVMETAPLVSRLGTHPPRHRSLRFRKLLSGLYLTKNVLLT